MWRLFAGVLLIYYTWSEMGTCVSESILICENDSCVAIMWCMIFLLAAFITEALIPLLSLLYADESFSVYHSIMRLHIRVLKNFVESCSSSLGYPYPAKKKTTLVNLKCNACISLWCTKQIVGLVLCMKWWLKLYHGIILWNCGMKLCYKKAALIKHRLPPRAPHGPCELQRQSIVLTYNPDSMFLLKYVAQWLQC